MLHFLWSQLMQECANSAQTTCIEARNLNIDINNLIHPYKMLIQVNLFDIDDWDDAEHFIAMALFRLSIFNAIRDFPKIEVRLVS